MEGGREREKNSSTGARSPPPPRALFHTPHSQAPPTMLDVDAEIALLVDAITRLGTPAPDGTVAVPFGVLFKETSDVCACAFFFVFLEGGGRVARVCARPRPLSSHIHNSHTHTHTYTHTYTVEALVGTLRAAKKRKVVGFEVRKRGTKKKKTDAMGEEGGACAHSTSCPRAQPLALPSFLFSLSGRAPVAGRPRRRAGRPAQAVGRGKEWFSSS